MAAAKFLGYAFGLVVAVMAFHKGPPVAENKAIQQTLTLLEEDDRILLAWSGPIAAPMRDQFAAVVDHYRDDKRRFVLSLNSPGGSVEHGREVMAAMREAAAKREIDTFVIAGGVCASMCLPIYLVGKTRGADPSAHFMFHEASVDAAAVKGVGGESGAALRKALAKGATDLLFAVDFAGPRVNPRWLAAMREQIVGREVWKSAQQLKDEGSGLIDVLAPSP